MRKLTSVHLFWIIVTCLISSALLVACLPGGLKWLDLAAKEKQRREASMAQEEASLSQINDEEYVKAVRARAAAVQEVIDAHRAEAKEARQAWDNRSPEEKAAYQSRIFWYAKGGHNYF